MITIFASIIGFLSSIIPSLIKYLKDIQDKKHELKILELKFKLKEENNINIINSQKDILEFLENLNLYSQFIPQTSWIENLNSSVRPIIAYCFFISYCSIKYIQYKYFSSHINFLDALENLWNLEDQAIFASIISFYFGQRTFKNIWQNKIPKVNLNTVTKKTQK